jgi:DnaJ-class molecular chaperone
MRQAMTVGEAVNLLEGDKGKDLAFFNAQYRKLVKALHPDVNKNQSVDDYNKFIQLPIAIEIIRQEFNLYGEIKNQTKFSVDTPFQPSKSDVDLIKETLRKSGFKPNLKPKIPTKPPEHFNCKKNRNSNIFRDIASSFGISTEQFNKSQESLDRFNEVLKSKADEKADEHFKGFKK